MRYMRGRGLPENMHGLSLRQVNLILQHLIRVILMLNCGSCVEWIGSLTGRDGKLPRKRTVRTLPEGQIARDEATLSLNFTWNFTHKNQDKNCETSLRLRDKNLLLVFVVRQLGTI
jgi:hypothetical protein